MSGGPWKVLGVEQTRDIAVIKRAYAARLKTCHPEDDPEGFQQLRAAYEFALRYATPAKPRPIPNIDTKRGRSPMTPPMFTPAPRPLTPEPSAPEAKAPQPDKNPDAEGTPKVEAPKAKTEAKARTPKTAPPVVEPQTPEPEPAPQPETTSNPEPAPKIDSSAPDTKLETPEAEAPAPVAPPPPAPPEPKRAPESLPQPAKSEPRAPKAAAPATIASPPPPPPAPPPVDPVVALQKEHDARCRALWRLATTGDTPAVMTAALAELFASAPMESVGVHGRTEAWLAGLIADNAPRTDPWVAPAIRYFGWREENLVRRGDPGARVLKRADDLRWIEGLRRDASAHKDAWRELNAKPTRWRTFSNRFTPMRAHEVRTLLELLHRERPELLDEIDPDASAWWHAYFARPQLSSELALAGALLALLFTFILPSTGAFGATPLAFVASFLVSFGSVAAVIAAGLYGVGRVRHAWMTNRQRTAPMWKRLGWAPGLLALVLLAAAAPVSVWATVAAAVLSLPLLYWVVITGEPDRRTDVGDTWRLVKFWNPIWMIASLVVTFAFRPALRFPWKPRAIFHFTYLVLFWVSLQMVLPRDTWLQLAAPIAVGVVAFSWGAGSLINAWCNELNEVARRSVRWALLGVVVLAGAAMIGVDYSPSFELVAAGLAVVAVFAHKTLDTDLKPGAWRARDIIMRYGWLPWTIVLGVVLVKPPARDVELRWGLWLISGPAFVAVATLASPLLDRAFKKKPKKKLNLA